MINACLPGDIDSHTTQITMKRRFLARRSRSVGNTTSHRAYPRYPWIASKARRSQGSLQRVQRVLHWQLAMFAYISKRAPFQIRRFPLSSPFEATPHEILGPSGRSFHSVSGILLFKTWGPRDRWMDEILHQLGSMKPQFQADCLLSETQGLRAPTDWFNFCVPMPSL